MDIVNYYLQTSQYTDLGLYKEFAKSLPDDIRKLCILQKMQTIHPAIFVVQNNVKEDKDNFYGDMTQIPEGRLNNEEDIFPTAISILAELLRRSREYSINREAKNKIHIICRGNAILLAGILKAKGIPARVRCGFAKYHYDTGICDDQWNTEYYDYAKKQWIMLDINGIDINSVEQDYMIVPSNKFIFAAEGWLGTRKRQISSNIKLLNLGGYKGLEAAWFSLVNDFNCIMNNEIPVTMEPSYLYTEKTGKWDIRKFTDKELEELDVIAELMLNIDKNFERLKYIYENSPKFKTLLGISTWN